MADPLQGKRILISAGPTWVPIDAVRHIGNFATGRLGLHLAREAARRGAAVTLLLGPARVCLSEADRAQISVLDYTYFDDLRTLVHREVGSRTYDAFLHSAAVSDYAPAPAAGQIRSGTKEMVLRLHPLPKIVDEVKPLHPGILLVKFKLEVGATRDDLIRIGTESRARSQADLLLANEQGSIQGERHPAVLLGPEGVLADVTTRDELVQVLLDTVGRRLAAAGSEGKL